METITPDSYNVSQLASSDDVYEAPEIDASGMEFIELGSGDDVYFASDNDNYIVTYGGSDLITGGAGDDIIHVAMAGALDNLTIATGGGANQIIIDENATGSYTPIAEGEGDTIYIDGMKGEFAMDVVGDDVVLIANGIEIVLQDQFAEDATSIFAELIFEDMPLILDPDAVDPTDPNQIGVLIGDSGDNVLEWAWDGGPVNIEGLGGNDLLIAGFSDDMLSGGEGNDFINGGSGDDELHGGQGDDILVGESGSDMLYGGAGSDVYAYNASYASFFDMAGMDEPEVIEGLESEWDIVSDNVDTIVDTEGELDVLLLTYFNPGPSPFDNYFDILEITEEGDLEYSMGASEHSSNHLQYGLYEDWEYSPSFDHTYKTVDPETGEESWVTDECSGK